MRSSTDTVRYDYLVMQGFELYDPKSALVALKSLTTDLASKLSGKQELSLVNFIPTSWGARVNQLLWCNSELKGCPVVV